MGSSLKKVFIFSLLISSSLCMAASEEPSAATLEDVPLAAGEAPTEGASDAESCSICLEDLGDKKLVTKTRCKHKFHKACLKQWLYTKKENKEKPTCPLCRRDTTHPVKKFLKAAGRTLSAGFGLMSNIPTPGVNVLEGQRRVGQLHPYMAFGATPGLYGFPAFHY